MAIRTKNCQVFLALRERNERRFGVSESTEVLVDAEALTSI